MVTVVDATTFPAGLEAQDTLADLEIGLGEEDERSLASLLVEQVEFADVIILNKLDLATPEQRRLVEARIRTLNATARIIPSVRSEVPVEAVVGTGLFDMEAAMARPAWAQELEGVHTPESEEYGISSFVYRARHLPPASPPRLARHEVGGRRSVQGLVLGGLAPERDRGYPLAGNTWESDIMGMWFAAVPPEQRDLTPEFGSSCTVAPRLRRSPPGDRGHRDRHGRGGLARGLRRGPLDRSGAQNPATWGALEHPFPWSEIVFEDEDELEARHRHTADAGIEGPFRNRSPAAVNGRRESDPAYLASKRLEPAPVDFICVAVRRAVSGAWPGGCWP